MFWGLQESEGFRSMVWMGSKVSDLGLWGLGFKVRTCFRASDVVEGFEVSGFTVYGLV